MLIFCCKKSPASAEGHPSPFHKEIRKCIFSKALNQKKTPEDPTSFFFLLPAMEGSLSSF